MTDIADVVIIGGGVIGASVAYHLAEAGCREVLILEREAQQGCGSTGKATGGVRAQFATDINIKMSLYSIDFFSRFEDATGHPCGYQPSGYLFLATNEKQLAYLQETQTRQTALGVDSRLVKTDDIARMQPELRVDDVLGGSFCPTDGFINALAVMRGFTARALAHGVQLLLEAEVYGIEVEQGRVAAVSTRRGRIETRAVVCAAGPWAAGVAKLAGVEIPVSPLRRQIVSARAPQSLPGEMPMVIDLSNGFHFRPDGSAPETNVLLAWPDPFETPGFKTEFDPAFTPKILACAQRRVPAWSDLRVDEARTRAGLYEMTPDHHAIICEAPEVGGLFLVNGFSGHGVMHSPAAGRMTAEMILHGQSRFLHASPLGAKRFSTDRLLHNISLN